MSDTTDPASPTNSDESGISVQSVDVKTSELIRVPEKLEAFVSPADRAVLKRAVDDLRAIEAEIESHQQEQYVLAQPFMDGSLPVDEVDAMRKRDVMGALKADEIKDQIRALDAQIEELKKKSSARVAEINGFVQSFGFDYLETQRDIDRRIQNRHNIVTYVLSFAALIVAILAAILSTRK